MEKRKSRILSALGVLERASWPAVLAIAAIFVSIAPALFAQQDVHASLIAPADRKAAPAFRLMAETGKTARLSDYRGKVVLLNFWATDCGGCVMEIPSIVDIAAAHKKEAFTVVGVSMDISYEDLKDAKEAWGKVRPFVAKAKINYPILMGDESLFREFGLTELPDTLLIDKSGRIAAVYVGLISKENTEANINGLLSER